MAAAALTSVTVPCTSSSVGASIGSRQKPRVIQVSAFASSPAPHGRQAFGQGELFGAVVRVSQPSSVFRPSRRSLVVALAPEETEVITSARAGLEEKFAVLDTGKWECRSCGYVYDQQEGDASYPVASGTEFRNLPEDWRCPTCGAASGLFQSKSRTVAGFAQNQKYGLGGNSLTSGQKSLLIYGALGVFFALFLSGYLLQ